MGNEFKEYEDLNEETNNKTIINNIVTTPVQKNNIGLAGFILSLVNLLASFLPFVGFIIWILGAVFSIIGLFKAPRGFAIAGTIISFIWLILMIIIILVFGTAVIITS